jgi:hypothetical protein
MVFVEVTVGLDVGVGVNVGLLAAELEAEWESVCVEERVAVLLRVSVLEDDRVPVVVLEGVLEGVFVFVGV